MYKSGRMFLMTAHAPLHPGAGRGAGAVDLPVQREAFTRWPMVQAGTLKGSLRAVCVGPAANAIFGPEAGPNAGDHAGCLGVQDAHVLFFPVQSLRGIFCYMTCPSALARFKTQIEHLQTLGNTTFDALLQAWHNAEPLNDGVMTVPSNPASSLRLANNDQRAVLEEILVQVNPADDLNQMMTEMAALLPGTLDFAKRVAVAHDDLFTDFVRYSTEVVTRNRIDDDTGTVARGALWIEEHLPRETVLHAPLFITDPLGANAAVADAAAVSTQLDTWLPADKYMWIGGDQTVGRGLVQTRIH